jgi:hypothetical protein
MARQQEDIISIGYSKSPNIYRITIRDKGNNLSRRITLKEHIGINPDYFLDLLYNKFKDSKIESPNRFHNKYQIVIELIEESKRSEHRFVNFSEIEPVKIEVLYQESRGLLLRLFSELSMQKFRERKE